MKAKTGILFIVLNLCLNWVNNMVEDIDYTEEPDFHAVVSIQLCELIDAGFCDDKLTGWEWDKYSDKQDLQLRKKLVNHYFFREIALTPPGIWKHEFIRKMNEIMPKYIRLYKLLDESPELFGADSVYYKSRDIYSDFPQTQLSSENADYATNGRDKEFQRINQVDIIDVTKRINDYNDIDLLIINDMGSLFSCLFSVNTNSY